MDKMSFRILKASVYLLTPSPYHLGIPATSRTTYISLKLTKIRGKFLLLYPGDRSPKLREKTKILLGDIPL